MEVASPLTFSHSAGTKRHLPCSTGFVDSANRSPFGMAMEPPEEYVNQRFKRRRCNLDDRMDSDSENAPSQFHHYLAAPPVPEKSVFSPSNGQLLKRCRNEAFSPQPDWKSLVQSQAQEIETLKSDKASIESSLNRIKGDQEKILNENRILKRAVTIQQERQNQAMSEIGAARQFKFEAEDRIKKLEHLISSLRYHLQTQQSNPGNDFMGFPPRPPDVY